MEGPDNKEMIPEILIKGNVDSDEKFAFTSYIIAAVVLCLTFCVLAYITYYVIRKVRGSDNVIPSMLIFLQLSALSSMGFFIY